mmetsp:Transcript_23497/g.23706  ORF Transcript_23497/g.23706 Transcript_23497/m.23706 type:complete len:364 (+) Transcript_23497:78-1169(+)
MSIFNIKKLITYVFVMRMCMKSALSILPTNARVLRTKHQCGMTSTSFDPEVFRKAQWELFKKFQLGEWKGIQTGYDVNEVDVADHMYFDTILEKLEDEDSVRHSTSVVVSEVRTDCEVCFDSEQIRTKEMGIYTINNLRSKYCENVEIKGPGMTPRGLSCETVIRHNNQRIRILIALIPREWVEVEGLDYPVPSSMTLNDVIVVREGLGVRPLDTDDPHPLWIPSLQMAPIFTRQYSGNRTRNSPDAGVSSTGLPPGKLPCHPLIREGQVEKDGDSIQDIYTRDFAGGIRVEASRELQAGEEFTVRISWATDIGQIRDENRSNMIYSVQYSFTALDSVIKDRGSVRLAPPVLRDLFVDKLISS